MRAPPLVETIERNVMILGQCFLILLYLLPLRALSPQMMLEKGESEKGGKSRRHIAIMMRGQQSPEVPPQPPPLSKLSCSKPSISTPAAFYPPPSRSTPLPCRRPSAPQASSSLHHPQLPLLSSLFSIMSLNEDLAGFQLKAARRAYHTMFLRVH